MRRGGRGLAVQHNYASVVRFEGLSGRRESRLISLVGRRTAQKFSSGGGNQLTRLLLEWKLPIYGGEAEEDSATTVRWNGRSGVRSSFPEGTNPRDPRFPIRRSEEKRDAGDAGYYHLMPEQRSNVPKSRACRSAIRQGASGASAHQESSAGADRPGQITCVHVTHDSSYNKRCRTLALLGSVRVRFG